MAIHDVNNPLASGELAKGSGAFKPKGPAGTDKTTVNKRVQRPNVENRTSQETPAQPAGDVYESTETIRVAAALTESIGTTVPEPREDAVNSARERVQSGYYNTREFLGRLASKLISTETGISG